jgi:hypothetical protein
MVCDSCGRKKKLFESFVAVKGKKEVYNLCSDCNDALYKLRDSANDGNQDQFNENLECIKKREKKPSEKYLVWKNDFISKQEKRLKDVIEVQTAKQETTT